MAEHSFHYASAEGEHHAQRLGMLVFLASEVLLFAALFTLYAALRYEHPHAFAFGINHNPKLLGSLNTAILITSSLTIALSVRALEKGRRTLALWGIAITVLFAAAFLVVKGIEYSEHFGEGIYPGGRGRFLAEHDVGLSIFYTLYYLLTGTHAIHVVIGMSVLSWLGYATYRGKLMSSATAVDLGALYWHLVDLIWIFLWPLFYLTGGK